MRVHESWARTFKLRHQPIAAVSPDGIDVYFSFFLSLFSSSSSTKFHLNKIENDKICFHFSWARAVVHTEHNYQFRRRKNYDLLSATACNSTTKWETPSPHSENAVARPNCSNIFLPPPKHRPFIAVQALRLLLLLSLLKERFFQNIAILVVDGWIAVAATKFNLFAIEMYGKWHSAESRLVCCGIQTITIAEKQCSPIFFFLLGISVAMNAWYLS